MFDDQGQLHDWLRGHLRGASAAAIAAHLGGYGEQRGDYPSDAGDFGRCEALLEAVPAFRARLAEMAEVNAYWHALVMVWDSLRALPSDLLSSSIAAIVKPIEALDPNVAQMGPGATMRIGGRVTFSHQDHTAAIAAERTRMPMKETPEDRAVRDEAYAVTADELRQFVERYEHLEAEKKDITDQQAEVMAEAKGRGYDTKVLKKIIGLRKRKPDELAEEQAVLDLYKSALGME